MDKQMGKRINPKAKDARFTRHRSWLSKYELFLEEALKYMELQDNDGAIALLKQAILLEPKRAEAHAMLGIAYANKYDDEEAIESFTKAIELAPYCKEAYYLRANLLATRYLNYKAALEDCQRVLELDPHFVDACGLKVFLHIGLDDKEEAERALAMALKLAPNMETRAELEDLLKKIQEHTIE
jgi:tetratricopeptide (TPR) repeat protein